MKLNVNITAFIKVGNEFPWSSVEKKCNLTLLKMLEEAVHADITFTAEGGSVKAHRSVLASISPVFKAMFEHQTKEHLTSTVELPEISIQGLKLFLALVYVLPDNIAAMEEFRDSIALHFDELLNACYNFQVQRLEPTLAEHLSSRLTPDNCWHYLRQSAGISDFCDLSDHMESESGPYAVCRDYIRSNFSKVIESRSFIVEMRTDPVNVRMFLRVLFRNGGFQSENEPCTMVELH